MIQSNNPLISPLCTPQFHHNWTKRIRQVTSHVLSYTSIHDPRISLRAAGAARPPPASVFVTRTFGMAVQMLVLAQYRNRFGYSSWNTRWIIVDHMAGIVHLYKHPQALEPIDSYPLLSSHCTIQCHYDHNLGIPIIKLTYLGSRIKLRALSDNEQCISCFRNNTIIYPPNYVTYSYELDKRPNVTPSNLCVLLNALNQYENQSSQPKMRRHKDLITSPIFHDLIGKPEQPIPIHA